MQNAIGSVGETIFSLLLTKFDPTTQKPLFHPQFMGDKWPDIDFYVELEGGSGIRPYFFVQVKATRQGYTKKAGKLKIPSIQKKKIVRLASYPAPTYVAGIDIDAGEAGKGWLLAVTGQTLKNLPSLPTSHPINQANRRALYDEVKQYWTGQSMNPMSSAFVTKNWP